MFDQMNRFRQINRSKFPIACDKASLPSMGTSSFKLAMGANEKYSSCVRAANWNFLFIFSLSLLR